MRATRSELNTTTLEEAVARARAAEAAAAVATRGMQELIGMLSPVLNDYYLARRHKSPLLEVFPGLDNDDEIQEVVLPSGMLADLLADDD